MRSRISSAERLIEEEEGVTYEDTPIRIETSIPDTDE